MGSKRGAFIAEAALVVGLLFGALKTFQQAAAANAYHPDEGNYIGRSRFFEYLFVRRDLGSAKWADSEATHTQLMLANYLVGASLWTAGYDLEALPPPAMRELNWYLLLFGAAADSLREEARTDPVLARARLPMVMIGVGVVGVLYLLGRALGGVVAGATAALLGFASPSANQFLPRALSEAPLSVFLLLSLLLGVLGARRRADGELPLGWSLAVGLALGLALGAKLTALLSLAAVLGWGIALSVLAAHRAAHEFAGGAAAHAWRVGRGWLLACAIALSVFVLSDPHLYPNPPLHFGHLISLRIARSHTQAELRLQDAPGLGFRSPLASTAYVLRGSLFDGTWSGAHHLLLKAALVGAGLFVLFRRMWRGWRGQRRFRAEGLVLVTLVVYTIGESVSLPLPVPRYILATVLLSLVLSGAGATVTADWLCRLGGALRQRLLLPQRA